MFLSFLTLGNTSLIDFLHPFAAPHLKNLKVFPIYSPKYQTVSIIKTYASNIECNYFP